jgi:abortive infection bacteriophage resistance protein
MEKKIIHKHTYTSKLTEAQLLSSDIKRDLYTIKNEQIKSYCKELNHVNNLMAHKVSRSPELDNKKFENNPELTMQFHKHDSQITEVHKAAKAHYILLKTEYKNHPNRDCSNTLHDFIHINKTLVKLIDTMVDIFF